MNPTTRRRFLAALPACSLSVAAPARAAAPSRPGRTIRGAVSGQPVFLPERDAPPMPQLADSGVVLDGRSLSGFEAIDPRVGHPDVLSARRKFGLLIPATNTSMEAELWHLLVRNADRPGLDGIGLHTANVLTPRPVLRNAADLEAYRAQFLGGLRAAAEQAELAQPHALIVGMSLEHIVDDLEVIRRTVAELDAHTGLTAFSWHDAAAAALGRFGARRIGLITPFDAQGNRNAARVFTALGFEVVSTAGFACANALHIAHIPDAAKERLVVEHLARPEQRLDAVVQCGTNLSFSRVAERLEPQLGIPVLGINATLLWYALRETGITKPLQGGGRLLREF